MVTKLETLLKSIQIWKLLSTDSEISKQEAYLKLGLSIDLNHCPLCEYVKQITNSDGSKIDCTLCPAKDIWQKTSPENPVCVSETLYSYWNFSEGKERKKYAKKLLNALYKELGKLIAEIGIPRVSLTISGGALAEHRTDYPIVHLTIYDLDEDDSVVYSIYGIDN